MKLRGSYIWAFLIAIGVVGWFLSDNIFGQDQGEPLAASEAEAAADETDKGARGLTVKALRVATEEIDVHIRASGVTRTSFDIQIPSRRKSHIEAIKASEGGFVKEGEILIELDKGTLAAQIDAARADRQAALSAYEDAKKRFSNKGTLAAQLTAAEAELTAITKNYNATEALVKRGLATDLDLTNQLAQMRAAETRLFELQSLSQEKEVSASYARLKAVDSQIAALEEQVSFATIRAPQSGWLEAIHVEKGEIVGDNQHVARLLGLSVILLDVPVPQARIADVTLGDMVQITINGDSRYQGKVQKIAAAANQATRTFDVEIALDNKDGSLRAGMSAEASIIIDNTKAYRISPAHLNVDEDGQLKAKIANQQNQVEDINVALIRTDGNMAYISGLEDGMILLAEGQAFLNAGETVTYKIDGEAR